MIFEGFLVCSAQFRFPHSISVGFKFKLWHAPSRTLPPPHSLMDILEYLGSLLCCKVHFWLTFSLLMDGLTLSLSTLCYNEKFKMDSMTVSCLALIQQSNPKPLHFYHHVLHQFLLMKCYLWVSTNTSSGIVAKSFCLCLIFLGDIVLEIIVFA